jgi:hypothetical protein
LISIIDEEDWQSTSFSRLPIDFLDLVAELMILTLFAGALDMDRELFRSRHKLEIIAGESEV